MESMSWSFWSPARGSSPEDTYPPQRGRARERAKSHQMKQGGWGRHDLFRFPVHQLSAHMVAMRRVDQRPEKAKTAEVPGVGQGDKSPLA